MTIQNLYTQGSILAFCERNNPKFQGMDKHSSSTSLNFILKNAILIQILSEIVPKNK